MQKAPLGPFHFQINSLSHFMSKAGVLAGFLGDYTITETLHASGNQEALRLLRDTDSLQTVVHQCP